jgi:glycosyltransferase involved in cell wall biosynthesis
MRNLAITSPSPDGHPETFVVDHKQIRANVFYYYGDMVPRYVEGQGLFSIDRASLSFGRLVQVVRHLNPIRFKKSCLGFFDYCFAQSLRKNKIDVVLSEYGDCSAQVMRACRYAHIPLVAHFHGRDCSAYSVLNAYKKQYQELFKYASYVVAVSHVMEKKLESLGCPKEKIVYSPCAPDKEFFEISPKFNNRQLLSVGRFVDKKAPYITLLAFKKVLDNFPDARLVMAGSGPLLPSCKHIAHILGMEDKVSFPGNLSHKEVVKLMSESYAYVQHSVTADDGDMEGTPVSVMEASAAGLPVISTFHAGIPDVIVDGKTGLLSNEYDMQSMVGQMLQLLSNTDLAEKMGQEGKRNMKENFSKEKQIDILTDIINKA